MAILQISALTAHISFLLWELIIWQTRSWQIYPPHQMAISQIPALTASCSKRSTFDRPGLGRSDPPHQMAISQIPVKFIFHSHSESSTFGWPGLGRSTHPHQMAISQIPALLWKLIFVRPSVGRSTPQPTNGNFTDVDRSTSPSNSNFTDSCSTLRAHIKQTPLSNGDFTDSCFDSSLVWELNIWQTRTWQI